MKKDVKEWLLDGPAWLKYAVELQLLDLKPDVKPALYDGDIEKIINRLKDKQYGIPAMKKGKLSYKTSAPTGNAYWDLFFLTDIGFTIKDLKLEKEMEEIFELQRPDGAFITWEEMKPSYFCISSIVLSSLAGMGYREDPRLKRFVEAILGTQRLDGGWHCAQKRAVGKSLQHSESCPMDNLNIMLLLGRYEEFRNDPKYNGALDLLLSHWEQREEHWRPYGFGVGTDFSRLKYPAIKYGILRVLDVLSLYPYAVKHHQFQDMLQFVRKKSSDGKYFAESVVKTYNDFDFGKKKEPSRWITFLVNRIIKRAADITDA